MKKRTTTHQISEVISNNLLIVTKAEYYNKSTYQLSTMDNDTFKESLQFLNESSVLADCVSWTYEKNYKSGREYIIEAGRMSDCNVIVAVYCCVDDGVESEQVEKMLMTEDE